MFKKPFIAALLALAGSTTLAATRYVTPSGAGLQDGSSWVNASPDIQAMINASAAGDQVWVSKGRYTPTHLANSTATISLNNRTDAFVMKADVQLYGGFSGTETAVTQRDSVSGLTVLSGDIGTVNTLADNAYHVVVASGSLGTATLNSFAVKQGYANGIDSTLVNGSYVVQFGGGGIACSGSSPAVANCVIDSNTAINKGGGMYNSLSSPGVVNCRFTNNTTNYVTGSSSFGGGLYNNQGAPVITGCTFYMNTANAGGSSYSVSAQGGAIFNYQSAAIITNCIIRFNTAHNLVGTNYTYGGGIFNYSSSASISGCTINKNAGYVGAGIYNNSSSGTVTNSTLDSNTIGSTVCNVYSTTAFTGCQLRYNTNTGPACFYNTYSSTPSITNCTITHNSQIGIYNSTSSGTITGCTISYNACTGVRNDTVASPTISNCTISYNGGQFAPTGGGVANVYYSSPTFTNCVITYNKSAPLNAAPYGGGVYNSTLSSPAFTNCTISNNTVDAGGGGGNYYSASGCGIYNFNQCSPTFTNCTITGNNNLNNTTTYGGGVCNELHSAPAFTRCNISNNSASYGGGICNKSISPATFQSCSITNNVTPLSSGYGGGVYDDSSAAKFTNCLISSNTDYQGAVYNKSSSSTTFSNTTICNNHSINYGGGIWQYGGSLTVNNSIIWGNNTGSGVYLGNAAATLTAKYSLIDGQNGTTNGNIAGTTNPMFIDTAAGNYNLQSASPCVNTGSNALYPGNINTDVDVAGRPRLYGSAIDMGAYELCVGLPTVTAQPLPATTCLNGSAAFSASLSSYAGFTYQWQKNGSNIPGATNTSYSKQNFSYTDTGWYKLAITSTVCGTLYTDSAKLTLNAPPVIIVQPTPLTQTLCTTTQFSLSGAANGTAVTYQWLKNGNLIAGATNATYIVNSAQLTDSGAYSVRATDTCGNSVTSQNAMVIVHQLVVPTISIAASQNNVCPGTSVTFTATITNGGTTPTYMWSKNGNTIFGTNNPVFTYTPANGDVVACIMSSSDGCAAPSSVNSSNITMTVATNVTPVVTITASPGTHLVTGQTVTFIASATNAGANPQYQWRKNGTNISGATQATYTAVAGTNVQDNNQISVSVTNTDPCGRTAVSNSLTLLVSTGTGIGQIGISNGAISLYPNPNDGSFTVKGTLKNKMQHTVTLLVYNPVGQNVYKAEVPVINGSIEHIVNMPGTLPPGNYFLKLNDDGNTIIRFTLEGF